LMRINNNNNFDYSIVRSLHGSTDHAIAALKAVSQEQRPERRTT